MTYTVTFTTEELAATVAAILACMGTIEPGDDTPVEAIVGLASVALKLSSVAPMELKQVVLEEVGEMNARMGAPS
jgi:hypothetical protein